MKYSGTAPGDNDGEMIVLSADSNESAPAMYGIVNEAADTVFNSFDRRCGPANATFEESHCERVVSVLRAFDSFFIEMECPLKGSEECEQTGVGPDRVGPEIVKVIGRMTE